MALRVTAWPSTICWCGQNFSVNPVRAGTMRLHGVARVVSLLRSEDGLPGGQIKIIPLDVHELGIYSLARVGTFTSHPNATTFDRGHVELKNDHRPSQ